MLRRTGSQPLRQAVASRQANGTRICAAGRLGLALRHQRRRLPRCRAQGGAAGGDAAAPPTPTDAAAGAGAAELSSSPPASDAAYVRAPIPRGARLDFPASVVVLGDVPADARLRAAGDVVVLGTVYGEAAAGSTGDSSAVVMVGSLGAGGVLSVAGRTPGMAAPREGQLMLLVREGAAQFEPMPGSPPLLAPAQPEPALPKVARTAAALGVLALGTALILSPGQLLGNLVTTNAEGVATALLDVFVFGFILLQGAGLLSDGSELLLEIVNPGIIGGVVLPVLGALPDSLIILTSLGVSRAEAQEAVAVGIGTLAGSTILLLSLAWGASVLIGRCDLSDSGVAIDKRLSRGWDLDRTGVTVEADVKTGAAIMAASVLLYGSVQVPAFLGFSRSPEAALAGAVMCMTGLVVYCVYSVLSPALQQRRIAAARRKRFRMVAVRALAVRSSERYGSLVDAAGRLDPLTVRSIFDEFDEDHSGGIDSREVAGLIAGLQLAGGGPGGAVDKDTVDYLMKEFDSNTDSRISFDEFSAALGRWVDERLADASGGGGGGGGRFSGMLEAGPAASLLADLPPDDVAALQETAAALEGEPADEAADDLAGDEGEPPLSGRDILLRALAKMGGGIALCAVFSDPLVDALTALSRATGIPAFVVGFVLTPLASNSSELVSSLNFAAKKRAKNMSLTLSQIYGAVTMNNTLVLGLFLMVVYLQRLEWVYSSEVTVIVAATFAIGALGTSRTTFKARWALAALALYPLSLAGVHVLDTWLGWQ